MGKVAKQIAAIKKNLKDIKTVLSGNEVTKFKKAAAIWKTVQGQVEAYNLLLNTMSNTTKTLGGKQAKIEKINKFNSKLEAFAATYGRELEKPCWSR